MILTLLVIRSDDPNGLADFYTMLGLAFEYHRHGKGPYHYSAHLGPTLFEIYPLGKGQEKADNFLRLGLALDSFDTTIHNLHQRSVLFHQDPTETEWGIMAIVEDPEGRKVELYKK
jgi:lactoylglutathione lyase